MTRIAVAIALAGALIAGGIAIVGRWQITPLPHANGMFFAVADQWSGDVRICRRYVVPAETGCAPLLPATRPYFDMLQEQGR